MFRHLRVQIALIGVGLAVALAAHGLNEAHTALLMRNALIPCVCTTDSDCAARCGGSGDPEPTTFVRELEV